MQKENERIRRYRKRETEPVKLNYRLISFFAVLAIAVIIKLLPSSAVKSGFEGLVSTTTDYPEMFTEIAEVIKRHTFGTDAFSMPVDGELTSDFGSRVDPITNQSSEHFGIDINAPLNTEIKAAGKGIVAKAEANSYYGNFILIDHGDGISSLYGHLNEILVKAGDEISAEDIIALSGDSGRTTGPHLHFEIRKDNTPVNPLSYIPQ